MLGSQDPWAQLVLRRPHLASVNWEWAETELLPVPLLATSVLLPGCSLLPVSLLRPGDKLGGRDLGMKLDLNQGKVKVLKSLMVPARIRFQWASFKLW